MPLRFALCNECCQGWTLPDTCRLLQQHGYQGIEIAPFTLAEDPATLTLAQRAEHRRTIEDHGLAFVGLHWLMVSPKGLHVTTSDAALYERSWTHIRHLIDLCADLGDNGVMVFGSPQQRNAIHGMSPADATRRYVDGLAAVAPHAASRGVRILIEALPVAQSNIVNTLDEAVAHVAAIGSPAVGTMFDTHNAIDEAEPHAALVDRHFSRIHHAHVNELDGRYPGAADYPFRPVLEVLARRGFPGWVSAEVFDFSPGPEHIASATIAHLRRESEGL